MASHLEKIITVSLIWYRSLSQIDRAKVDADDARSFAEKTAEFNAVWGLADTSKKGILLKREFPSLLTIQDQRKSARGVPTEPMTD